MYVAVVAAVVAVDVGVSRCLQLFVVCARNSDFSRLARRLTGTSIGLVLGGGGAR